MTRPHLDDIDRDAFDALARERDHHREPLRPGSRPPTATPALPSSAARPATFPSLGPRAHRAFQALILDKADRAHAAEFTDDEVTQPGTDSEVGIVELRCPACEGPVFVSDNPPANGDRVDCWTCKTPLIARATEGGGVAIARIHLTRGP